MLTVNKIKQLPDTPGVYIFYDRDLSVIYVGKSVSIKKRVASYFSNRHLGPKTGMLVSKIENIGHLKVFSEFEALLLEAELIRKHKPFYNVQAKDDKSPLYIKISSGEIPLVELARKQIKEKGDFVVGPFPSAKSTREVMRLIRRIFPYCQHKKAPKKCLYVHLGLCPYPYSSEEAKEKYRTDIEKIKKFLSGKSKAVVRQLMLQMKELSSGQKYEDANEIKKQIAKIEYLLTKYHTPREFLETPTLVDDLAITRLKDIKETLDLEKIPKRIECFDISNFQGKLATGSMAVFIDGRPEKSQYRRFKIKFSMKPNDYEMFSEVLRRRLKNDWPAPDLIIVDGGRGQLNAALSTLSKFKFKIPVVSLAKRLEEIFVPAKVLPISLPKESPARQLVQALRDEAHRFAISYHRMLRSKEFIANK